VAPARSRHALLSGESMAAYARQDRMLADINVEEPGTPPGLNQTKLAHTQCVVDVVQASAYLGQAIVWIDKAVTYEGYRCPDDTQRGCTVSVSAVITAMLWLASYLSLTASSCSATLHAKAACAADITGVMANLGEVSTAGTAAADDCKFEDEKPGHALVHKVMELTHHSADAPLARRLSDDALKDMLDKLSEHKEEKQAERQAKHDRSLDLALCVFDTVQGASYVVRAAKQIMGAAIDTCEDPTVCTINVFSIVSSFAWIAQFFSFAAGDCAVKANQAAFCAGDISDLIAATTNLVATAMVLPIDCGAAVKEPAAEWSSDKELEEVQETKRRLRTAALPPASGA